MRFLVQWIASERARASVIPVAFWFFSIGGGVLLLIYALYRRDPVFIAGQALGLVVYVRNLYFIMINGWQTSAKKTWFLPDGTGRACSRPLMSSGAGHRARIIDTESIS